ncbi:MAG: lipoate--protein ligase family protein [Gemmatimonadales bacterium]
MALDAALLDFAAGEGGAFLRLYRWDPFCLSFGFHEPALRRYDRARIEALGLSCVRRPTGGRAVWHARELTYAVAAPLDRFGGLRQAYAAIHRVVAAALSSLGAPARLAPRGVEAPRPSAGPCFAAPVGGEVLVRDRKAVGSAQVRLGEAFLQHGSILLEDDQTLVADLAGIPPAGGGGITLSSALDRRVGFEEVAGAIRQAWESAFPVTDAVGSLPSATAARAAAHAERFRDEGWTWRR